jgi:hypothetical protein
MGNVELMRSLSKFRAEASVGKSGRNPMFRSEYTTLGDVLNALAGVHEYGLTFDQYFDNDALITDVMHLESGELFSSRIIIKPEKDTPQAFMSCVTYLRRASLMTMFGLNADDDDANSATSFAGRAVSPSSGDRQKAGDGVVLPTSSPAPKITDKTLADALIACANEQEINDVYKRLFSSKNIKPTDDQIELFKMKKEKVKGLNNVTI